jgi:PAP2 superfamily
MRAGVNTGASKRRRFSGRREVAIGLGVYALYLLASRRKRGEEGRLQARRNAERVVAFERRLGIHVEPQLQSLVLPYRRFLAVLNVAYVVSNAALTVGWLMLLYARRDPEFHRLRRAAVLTTLACQPVFYFFPCAPPRSLDDLVDTIADVSGLDLDSGPVAQLYDPLAAMPSIHVAYAVVTAAGVALAAESPALRALAPAYPPLVAAVVFVTANHYVLDAVAGAGVAALGLRLARALGD